MAEYVHIESAEELIASLRALYKQVGAEITKHLRVMAREVAMTAKGIATYEGFAPPGRSGRGSGALLSGIGYSVKAGAAFVKERATRAGYPYPAIYEFGPSGRKFLQPARNLMEPKIYDDFERMLNDLIANEGLT